MRSLIAVVALFVASAVYAAGVSVCVGGNCGVGVDVHVVPNCVGGQCVPQTIYQPRVYYQPYRYQGSVVSENRYPTPVRNWMFGRFRSYHYYTPVR